MTYHLQGTTPYVYATTGRLARDEITRQLRKVGCTAIGFMDDFTRGEVILQFEHRGRKVMLRASAHGWAALHMRSHPYQSRMKVSEPDYEAATVRQGHIAVNSILRDWVKGQLTAIECGLLSFETVFMPHFLLPSGETVAERITGMKLLALEGGAEP
jgi:hypothetical protein